jgi:3-hydroxyacyl-[acyl-carrier-protein] dehydratase
MEQACDVALDAERIVALIPHRAPFLFVRSARRVSATEITGEVRWDADNPNFGGHFPAFPVVPGVLLIEAAAQLAGLLIASRAQEGAADASTSRGKLGMLIGVQRASFHKPVLPEDVLRYQLRLGNAVGGMFSASAQALNAQGHKVFKGEISVAAVDRHRLPSTALEQ